MRTIKWEERYETMKAVSIKMSYKQRKYKQGKEIHT